MIALASCTGALSSFESPPTAIFDLLSSIVLYHSDILYWLNWLMKYEYHPVDGFIYGYHFVVEIVKTWTWRGDLEKVISAEVLTEAMDVLRNIIENSNPVRHDSQNYPFKLNKHVYKQIHGNRTKIQLCFFIIFHL
ncbi:unnamed protein product [Moneuplotes crassus]|uniref:Uncharacterized protein n=1 Tax=Euplotes crassus TaxID=5936 RepID=A0AAD1XMZ5_EUPCR|nr:unnamed protein product [Moneuplotes crassus]